MPTQKNAPGAAGTATEGKETTHHQEGCFMSDRNLLALLAVSEHLGDIGATIEEILDNSGYTLGEAMAAAARAGMDPEMDYRKIPLIPANAVDEIRRRILTERAEMAGIDADLESPDDAPINLTPTPKGWAAPLNQLKTKARESKKAVLVTETDWEGRGARPPLPYMTEFCPGDHLNIASDLYRTPHVTIPLSAYDAWHAHNKNDDTLHMAVMSVGLCQYGTRDYPMVELERRVGIDGQESGAQARYELFLDEAEQLAHALLLLLDVARSADEPRQLHRDEAAIRAAAEIREEL